jgi:RNA polymerase sigma factor (TIGR02999 family)
MADRDAAGGDPIKQLLADWANRDPGARDGLVPIVYEELRRLAHHYMRGEREGHTLQTTALVNEVYLRLAGIDGLQWRDRAHFFAMAATLMRRVLVDHARQRGRDKRGGGVSVVPLDETAVSPQPEVDVVALDEALQRLAAVDPQQCRVVELRFFAGLSVEETAEALGVSAATVKRDWATARLWLYHELERG